MTYVFQLPALYIYQSTDIPPNGFCHSHKYILHFLTLQHSIVNGKLGTFEIIEKCKKDHIQNMENITTGAY